MIRKTITISQPHSVRIDMRPDEYAELTAKRAAYIGHGKDMMVRSMIEDALLAWKINKTAQEIADFAWKLEVDMANALIALKKHYEDPQA